MAKAWDGSTRRERLPKDWTSRRAYILERDGYRCRAFLPDGRRCPRDATDIDHILEDDNDAYSNLQSLCRGHHLSKTGKYAGKQSQAARKRRRNLRKPEQHWRPGGATD